MRLGFKVIVISSLLMTPVMFSACTSGDFTAASNKKAAVKGGTNLMVGDPGEAAVSVPIGSQKFISDIVNGSIESCTSDDATIATADPDTCTLTGIKVGTTRINAVLSDGTNESVTVTVTPISSATESAPLPTSTTASSAPPVSLTVGSQVSVPGGGTSCTSDNAAIATVDPATCIITGVNAGNTTVKVSQGDGSVTSVPVVVSTGESTVTSPPPDEGLITTDGETSITGRVCLGGPKCNISYVTRSEADAQTCMRAANSRTCQNDPKCGAADQLQVCNCDCQSATTLPFTSPGSCRRTNPLKPGAIGRIAQCHAI